MLTNISRLLSITQPKYIQIEMQETVILSTVLYGSKTWSLTLRQETYLVFKNRVLRNIFGHKREKETGK